MAFRTEGRDDVGPIQRKPQMSLLRAPMLHLVIFDIVLSFNSAANSTLRRVFLSCQLTSVSI